MFFCKDSLIFGTPDAVTKSIANNRRNGGLRLKKGKCDLYGAASYIDNKTEQSFIPKDKYPPKLKQLLYLKVPFGTDRFVEEWLKQKLHSL